MKILVFAEERDGQFKRAAFESLTAAVGIAKSIPAEVIALVVGDGVSGIAPQTGHFGASRAIVVDDPRLGRPSTTAYAKVVADVARRESADVIMMPASAMGKDISPRVAAKLGAGLASDCTALTVSGGNILAMRPVYAGKGIVEVAIATPTKIFALRPNVFAAGPPAGAECPVESIPAELADEDFGAVVSETKSSAGKKDVAEADIIVSGGRGLKGPENFAMIEDLAGALNGAVGASRAVVDAGWRPHEEQVGQTGKTVSPSLYIAVAISGAVQHLAGMSSSKCIVAINKDKDAPIFTVADYGIVGDAFEIVPALTKEVKRLREGGTA
ncbi:MAG TPA: electron transfer flavoprotein subunit alpha/FixB family protein [Bacteroidota bacterium]|nr:electron transfer flavoprotein subunit alpha/FixB family protein [Bacteroidota bacterium]